MVNSKNIPIYHLTSVVQLPLTSLCWSLTERPKQDPGGCHLSDQPAHHGLHLHRPGQRARSHRHHQLHAHLQLHRLLLLQRGHDLPAAEQGEKGRPHPGQEKPAQVCQTELQAASSRSSPQLRERRRESAEQRHFIGVHQGHGSDVSSCLTCWHGGWEDLLCARVEQPRKEQKGYC